MKNSNLFYAFEEKLKIDLSLSENPLGCSPKASRAAINAVSKISQYPDPKSEKIRQILARRFGVNKNLMVFGNGSESLIDLTCRALLKKQDEVIIPNVTFWIFEVSTKLNEGKPVFVNLTTNMEIDLKELKRKITKKTKLIFLCNPNNPTGKVLPFDKILKFIKEVNPVVVVVDEAIIEFAGKSLVPTINKIDNLIVLRTFSKAFGLAGLRFGVAFSSPALIKKLEKFVLPFPINKVAQETVATAFSDEKFLTKTKIFVKKQREMLLRELKQRGFLVFDSETNNLLIKITNTKSEGIKFVEKLKENNVSVVSGTSFRGLDESFIRISIRDEKTNRKFLKVIDTILAD